MTRIARDLLWGELSVRHPFIAGIFPGGIAAGHRSHMFIAHFFERPSGDERADATGAIRHDGCTLIRHGLFDAHFEKAARQRDRAFEMAFTVLLAFPHIEQGWPRAVFHLGLHLVNRDFRYGVSGLGHEFLIGLCHILPPRESLRLQERRYPGPLSALLPDSFPAFQS